MGGRWSLLVVRELLVAPRRFSELRAALPGVASNLLTDRLRELEELRLIERVPLAPPASGSIYRLTSLGRGLEEPVAALVRWGAAFMQERRRDQEFQGHWLVVALRALFPAAPRGVSLRLSLLVEGAPLCMEVGRGRVSVEPGSPGGTELQLTAPGHVVLGLMSGKLSLSAAERLGAHIAGSRTARKELVALIASTPAGSLTRSG